MARILIVEDEERISAFIAKGLRADGHLPTVVADGRVGLDQALSGDHDLTVQACVREGHASLISDQAQLVELLLTETIWHRSAQNDHPADFFVSVERRCDHACHPWGGRSEGRLLEVFDQKRLTGTFDGLQ